MAVETYLIFAVQANLNRKYTVFLFRVEVTMVFLNDIVSDYLLITNHFVAWKAIHGNVNQTTFQELQKFALCENQKVAIEPKLASCILVVLAGCLTAAFVWFTFICR